jgi:hypothetical protein
MLYGTVGATFLSMSAYAGDNSIYLTKGIADYAPAVDGVNAKVETLGGKLGNRTVAGSLGAVSIPLPGPLGIQFDGGFGSFDHRGFGHIAGHFFWRNPGQGLLGIYSSYTYWDQFNGAYVGQLAVEGEYYAGRWTLQGIAGVETGNAASNTITGTTIIPPGVGFGRTPPGFILLRSHPCMMFEPGFLIRSTSNTI